MSKEEENRQAMERALRRTAYITELMCDKQDDDWSAYGGFSIKMQPSCFGRPRYRVVANGWIHVGTYDRYDAASLVVAKLEYRRNTPFYGMIGLDGLGT